MHNLIWILLATIFNSLLGLIGIFSLAINKKYLNKIIPILISFSAGALIGGAFFHLMIESLEILPEMRLFIYVIIGFFIFFLIEGYFHWHHCDTCHKHPFTYTMLIGDSIHNFIDGLVIAAAFSANISLGIITTAMIMAHEIPQEIGLFGVLIHGKYKKKKALYYSFMTQSTCILGGIIGFFTISKIDILSSFLVPFAAGGFIYIAASDLVPEMHKLYKGNFRRSISVLSSFIIGLLFMLLLKYLVG